MISQNDLYDITFAFVTIRNDIQDKFNKDVLSKIITVLTDEERAFEDNQIRKALASINGIDQERWYYVYYSNVYVNRRLLKNKYVYELLVKLCKELNRVLERKNYEMAYDLVDCFHCLPDIIADNCFTIPKSFWKSYVKLYRDKWDKTFLITEQKSLKNYSKNR